jgi:predicted TIM-barrel fold metal-dependent hydrolase
VDVDSHFFETFSWMKTAAPKLWDELNPTLPSVGLLDLLLGELFNNVPHDQRGTFRAEYERMFPFDFLARADEGPSQPEELEARFRDSPFGALVFGSANGCDPAQRVKACDEQGIDIQFLNPSFAMAEFERVHRHRPERLPDVCEAYNNWALGVLDGYLDRLMPAITVDFSDPARAVKELTRTREAGARNFLFRLHPVGGKSLSHPDFDDIWAAAADLGMVATMHIGFGAPVFDPGWANSGRPGAAASLFRLANTLALQVPHAPLCDLLFNGVFERHPDLIVLCSEFGLSWVLGWWEQIGPTTHRFIRNTLIPWDLPLSPQDYIRRNVRFSPLPGDPIDRFLADFGPDSLWFCSDYPHPEGSATAVSDFTAQLTPNTSPEVQERFFGLSARSSLGL